MIFQFRANRGQIHLFYIIYENDNMRISHADECSFVFFSIDQDSFCQHSTGFHSYLSGV